MNRKSAIVLRSLVAMTFASGPVVTADAGLIRIVHLDCAQWHARLARLAYRKDHPLPQQTHHFVGGHHRPRIHFVCDCKDGSADAAEAADVAAPDEVGDGGGVTALLGGASSQPFLSIPGGSSGQTSSAASSGASSEAASGGFGSTADSNSYASTPSIDPGGVDPYDPTPLSPNVIPFNPSPPAHFPSGPLLPPVDPPHPIPGAPEPATWLLFGLGAAVVLGVKRRRDGAALRAMGSPGARRSRPA